MWGSSQQLLVRSCWHNSGAQLLAQEPASLGVAGAIWGSMQMVCSAADDKGAAVTPDLPTALQPVWQQSLVGQLVVQQQQQLVCREQQQVYAQLPPAQHAADVPVCRGARIQCRSDCARMQCRHSARRRQLLQLTAFFVVSGRQQANKWRQRTSCSLAPCSCPSCKRTCSCQQWAASRQAC